MKERPMLMSAPMVRALLNCTKSQTRRAVKTQPPSEVTSAGVMSAPGRGHDGEWSWLSGDPKDCDSWGFVGEEFRCPYGQPGDRLYVRETWQHSNHPYGPADESCAIFYRADYWDDPHGMDGEKSPEGKYREWRPSIHMPRWASRILLEIVDVRVERLQDISESDAMAEGCSNSLHLPGGRFANENFAHLWWTINGDGSWEANPWVWVVEFKVIKP